MKGWTAADREALRRAVPDARPQGAVRNTTAQKVAREMVALARSGLARRGRLNSTGENETIFLTELEEIAESGISPAEHLLAKYDGEWKRDLRHAFEEVRF